MTSTQKAKRQISNIKVVCVLLLMLSSIPVVSASSTMSVFTTTPPTIDGQVTENEWDNAASIPLGHGSMLVENDNSYIYLLVDLTGDTTNDPPPSTQSQLGDFFSLGFDVNIDKAITSNVDLHYGLNWGAYKLSKSYYLGPGVSTVIYSTTSQLGVGFGPSMNSATSHRIWEFAISRQEILAQSIVRIGLRTYSQTPSFDDILPSNFENDFSNLIEISLATTPTSTPTVTPSHTPTPVPTQTHAPTEAPLPKHSEFQDKIDWMLVSAILAILLISVIILLLYKLKERSPKATPKTTPEIKPPQKYKTSRIILILLLIVVGSIGYTIYQKYSPLAELANCGNNCIDYKKMQMAQYETSVPDIKITNADTDKLIMDIPIIIRNPSAKDTETVKIDFDVSMEGKHLTKGIIPAYELPAKQNTTILIKDVVIKYEELGEVLQTVTARRGAEMVREGKANISMTTDLLIYFPIELFSINIYTFTIPIQIESEVPVDMLKQNEEAKKQIEEKVKTALKEVQEQIKGISPTLPTSAPTPSLPTPIATPTLPLPTPTLPGFP